MVNYRLYKFAKNIDYINLPKKYLQIVNIWYNKK